MDEYKCCFDASKNCSVRNLWKLKPESLVEFCKICGNRGIQGTQDDFADTFLKEANLIVTFFNSLITQEKQEKKELLKMVMDMVNRPQ